MIRNSKLTLLLTILFFALPILVHAESNAGESDSQPDGLNINDSRERTGENNEKKQERLDERQQNRCENKKRMIDNRIKMFRVSEKFHKEKYTRIYDRLSSLIERLDTQEIDISKLKSDLETIKVKIDVLKVDYDTLMNKLEELKDADCEDTEANKASLDEIRELLKELKDNANDIREFFINTIKPDLKEIREKLKTQKDSNNNGRNSETSESEGN